MVEFFLSARNIVHLHHFDLQSGVLLQAGWLSRCFEKCTLSATLATIVVATVVLVLIFVGYYRRKDKLKIVELEQRLLLSQMNPHFVFNSLTAIQSYIFRNDPYQAGKYLASFSKLVRLILENSRVEQITIGKEKETIEHYLNLQLMRFDSKFDFAIDISPDIDLEHHLIPPMLAQPFIENAIEHGIIHLNTKGRIVIRFLVEGNVLKLEVEDNGVGLEKSSEPEHNNRKKHQSLATRITKERLRNLRKVYGKLVKMEMINLSSGSTTSSQGTLVRFYIPLIIK
jgi:sensor histidine kinase YesM